MTLDELTKELMDREPDGWPGPFASMQRPDGPVPPELAATIHSAIRAAERAERTRTILRGVAVGSVAAIMLTVLAMALLS